MNKKQLPQLYKEVCNVLWFDWDPIGINQSSVVNDEYNGYAAVICRRLLKGTDENELAAHLRRLRIDELGLGGEEIDKHDYSTARKLLELVKQSH